MPLRNQFRHHPVTVAFRAFGVDAAVTVPDAGWRAEVTEMLPPGAAIKAPSAGDGRFALTATPTGTFDGSVGDEPVFRDGARDVALEFLDTQLRLYVADQAPDHVFIHAGVVARNGRALMIPGESFSGKTTLVTALLGAGADYLSDEFAVLDPTGRVHPYPRRLSASDREPPTATDAYELAGVLITRYSREAEWAPTELSRAQGCLAVLEQAVPARNRPQASLDAIDKALTGATILSGARGEAGDAAAVIVERFPWLGAPSRS